jgi:membrane-anchored mycosin MYCP
VTVAVLDSGVDALHPQLKGRVLPGTDFTTGTERPGGTEDCQGHGTEVAGLIAAGRVPGVGMTGVAPAALIRPVRVTVGLSARTDYFIAGLWEAVNSGAEVVNVSATVREEDLSASQIDLLTKAVEQALKLDVLIVAASGNRSEYQNRNANTYPALMALKYPNVVAVSGIDKDGAVYPDSITGRFVTMSAPADALVCPAAKRVTVCTGTSFAAAFVSGTAALVRSRNPFLTAAAVREVLEQSADPVPAGAAGYPIVQPVRAVIWAAPISITPPRPAEIPWLAIVVTVVAFMLAASMPLIASIVRRGRVRERASGRSPLGQVRSLDQLDLTARDESASSRR